MLNPIKKISFVFSCIPLLLVSCTSTVFDESDKLEKVPISFSVPQTVTRAVVNDGTDLSDFRVWGWRRVSNDATEYFSVFDGEKVTKDSGWNYEGGIRYWNKGEFYDFYAVHPVYDDVNIDNLGNITINNFNCSVIGENAVDLMIAARQNMNIPQKTDLKFSHELSKVNIIVKSEGSDIIIKSISLINAGYFGNFSSDTWSITSKSTEGVPATFSKSDIPLNPDGTEVNVFGDMLLLPLSRTDFDSMIKIEYSYLYNEQSYDSGPKEISLNTATVTSWDKGGNYKYTITIPRLTEELKLDVRVLPWDKVDNANVEW